MTEPRRCGECTLCCTVLRVEELSKLGGRPCVHQRESGGCGIYERRPQICRAYRCLWLQGSLEEGDRPDRLGAVLDLFSEGGPIRLDVREAAPGAFDRSPRLREIAEHYRTSMPVRISDTGDVMDADRPVRVLLPGGEEQRVAGDRVTLLRDGEIVSEGRLPALERGLRRVVLALRRWKLRRYSA